MADLAVNDIDSFNHLVDLAKAVTRQPWEHRS